MDRLPPELRDQIIAHYADPGPPPSEAPLLQSFPSPLPLSPLSTVSKAWRDSVERLTFFTLDITQADLPQLALIVAGPRRTLLTRLSLTVLLPEYPHLHEYHRETEPDRAANNAAATEAVGALFAVLSTWAPAGELGLSLTFESPSDGRAPGLRGGGERRYQYSVLRIEGASRLPQVCCVTDLGVGRRRRRCLDPGDILELTARLPRARAVRWATCERGRFPVLRRDMRARFAAAARAHSFRLPASVLRLDITIPAPAFTHAARLPDLAGQLGHDDVPAAVRRLSTSAPLEELRFAGMADPSLLWPAPGECAPAPSWPALENLRLELSAQAPSGRWYFRGRAGDPAKGPEADVPLPDDVFGLPPPECTRAASDRGRVEACADTRPADYDRDDERFRVRPDDELMVPLLEAFARAMGRMPCLKVAFLTFDAQRCMFLVFVAPGHVTDDLEPQSGPLPVYLRKGPPPMNPRPPPPVSAPRLFVYLQGWRMGSALEGVFGEAGRRVYEAETVVRYLDYDELGLEARAGLEEV